MIRVSEEAVVELKRIQDGNELQLEKVVDAARDPASPLHSYFEWHDGEAARLYRLQQARDLVKSARITYRVSEVVTSVVYVPTPSRANTYRELGTIPPSSDLARATVRTELGRLTGQLNRIRGVAKVLGLEEELNQLLRGLADMDDKTHKAA